MFSPMLHPKYYLNQQLEKLISSQVYSYPL